MFWPKHLPADSERFLVERFGFGVLPHCPVQHSQAIDAVRRIEVFRSKNVLPDPKRFLVEWLGFGVLAQILVQRGQVIEAERCVGIFRSKHLLPDPERFLVEWLGFGVVPDLLENEPEVIQDISGLGVIRTQSALCQFHGSFRNGYSLLIFSLSNQLAYLLVKCVWIIVFGQRFRTPENPEAKC